MPTRPPTPISLDPDTELHARCLALLDSDERRLPLLTLPTDDDEPKECLAWRRDMEQKAGNGDVTALSALLRFSPRYLACPWTVAVIQGLRNKRRGAKTPQERAPATEALDLLAKGLRGGADMRGKRPRVDDKDVAALYRLLLPLYEAAQKGVSQNPIELPRAFYRYLAGRTFPWEGIEEREAPVRLRLGGKQIELLPCYWFSVPKGDADRLPRRHRKRRDENILEEKMNVDGIVKKRVACILRLAPASFDLDWITRLIRRGRTVGVK